MLDKDALKGDKLEVAEESTVTKDTANPMKAKSKASYKSNALVPCPNKCKDKLHYQRLLPRHLEHNCPTEQCGTCPKKLSPKLISKHETICAKKVQGRFRCRCGTPF